MVELIVSPNSIGQESVALIAVGFFEDERPLRLEAGLIDKCLAGLISSRLTQGFMTGQLGETTLIPSNGKVEADKILFVGLGGTADFSYGRIRLLAQRVVEVCIGLQVNDVAVAFPSPLGCTVEWDKLIEVMMEGIGLVLERREGPLHIRWRLTGGRDHYDEILQGIETGRQILKDPFPIRLSREESS
jgi:hypothetical protein